MLCKVCVWLTATVSNQSLGCWARLITHSGKCKLILYRVRIHPFIKWSYMYGKNPGRMGHAHFFSIDSVKIFKLYWFIQHSYNWNQIKRDVRNKYDSDDTNPAHGCWRSNVLETDYHLCKPLANSHILNIIMILTFMFEQRPGPLRMCSSDRYNHVPTPFIRTASG